MNHNQYIGEKGEDIASKYLEKIGWQIVSRNFRCKQGEIDIIARNKEELIFIEVKTRTNMKYGFPAEAVNKQKLKHLIKAIKYYLYINNINNKTVRIDIIETYFIKKYNPKRYTVKVNHIKNII